MFVRLKLEDSRDGLVATISKREADGKIVEPPVIFLAATKEEAKRKASAVAKGLGLTSYRVMDKSAAAQQQGSAAPGHAP
ncbi:MAG TPA: hypothetical protein VNV18_00120 [Stellaceae bacterium]|jgi:hypothetical protein|nr:hypothetical protein [Stellaceae bacterium]